eukprot:7225306-Alexandrium_andersonii.AAC.1
MMRSNSWHSRKCPSSSESAAAQAGQHSIWCSCILREVVHPFAQVRTSSSVQAGGDFLVSPRSRSHGNAPSGSGHRRTLH